MLGKKFRLKVLDLDISVGWDQEYCDDGFKEDLARYALELKLSQDPEMDLPIREAWLQKFKKEYKKVTGITQVVRKPWLRFFQKEEVHIAYINPNNDIVQHFIRARQETSALFAFGQIRTFEEALKEEYGFDFFNIDQKKIANLGGIYGLLKNKFTIEEIARHADLQVWESLREFNRHEHARIEYEAQATRTGPYKKIF